MSKGHMEALAALKARKADPVMWGKPAKTWGSTTPLPRSVTHCATCTCGQPAKKAMTAAEKQKAYRNRKKAKA